MLSPIVYHGTFAQFSKFDKSKLGSSTGAPSSYEGFFFASNKKVAESYASNVTKRLKDCEDIKYYAENEIKKLTGNSYIQSTFKYTRREYPNDIDEKLTELYNMITTCDDYEAGIQDFPIAYDHYLDESGNLKEVQLILNNPLTHDMEGNDYRDISYKELILKAKLERHDSVIIKNTYDGGDPVGSLELTDIYVVFDESQIKELHNKNDLYDIDKISYVNKIPTQPTRGGIIYEYDFRTWTDFKLPNNIIEKMRNKISISEEEKIETGFLLCLDKKNNTIIADRHTKGTRFNIDQEKMCTNQENESLGTYHVHPDGDADASLGDLQSAYYDGMKCIGGVKDKKIRCYIRKVEYDTKSSNIITKAFHDYEIPLINMSDEILKSTKHKESINKMFKLYETKKNEIINTYFKVYVY